MHQALQARGGHREGLGAIDAQHSDQVTAVGTGAGLFGRIEEAVGTDRVIFTATDTV